MEDMNTIDISLTNSGGVDYTTNLTLYSDNKKFLSDNVSVSSGVTNLQYTWDLDDISVGTNDIRARAVTDRINKHKSVSEDERTYDVLPLDKFIASVDTNKDIVKNSEVSSFDLPIKVANSGAYTNTKEVVVNTSSRVIDSRNITLQSGGTVSYDIDLTSDDLNMGTNTLIVSVGNSTTSHDIDVLDKASTNISFSGYDAISGSLFVDVNVTNTGDLPYNGTLELLDSSRAAIDTKSVEISGDDSLTKTLVWEDIPEGTETVYIVYGDDEFTVDIDKGEELEPTIGIIGNPPVSDFYIGVTGLALVFISILGYFRIKSSDSEVFESF